ncbi:MAG TPA: polysaccharide deacetylase [Xanthobacteraceae bacterium]|nr:polysaccharide deacetylase [Xanthobacteraceae bacterium]
MKAFAAVTIGLLAASTSPACAVERPPQFVAIAFDNCTELERWQELSDFAGGLNRDGDRIHFTFFVSGINYLAEEKRAAYEGPHQRRGASNINFGGSVEDVKKRIAFINDLHARGHEIASHAVGHFDGRGWSAADWDKEFTSYADLLDNAPRHNGFSDGTKLAFPAAAVIGFRAPYMSTSPGLYPALRARGFRYDTSSTSEASLWPEQKEGVWRFNLADLKLHRSNRHTLSMDYNFFIVQAFGLDNSGTRAQHRDEMLETYVDYFKANYAGDRAPLNIGHHFFNYHGGAYNEALKAFARAVCGLPEVRCVSYVELADFMDKLDPATLEAFRKGDFEHRKAPDIDISNAFARAAKP